MLTDAEIVSGRIKNPQLRACCPERKMQTVALNRLEAMCDEIFARWDKDQRSGKLLSALSGRMKNYRIDVDLVRAALSAPGSPERTISERHGSLSQSLPSQELIERPAPPVKTGK